MKTTRFSSPRQSGPFALAAPSACGVLVLVAALSPSQGEALAAPVRRFALLVAHNEGGPGTSPLKYAEVDAEKLRAVLVELGGFASDDVLTVLGGSADDVLARFSELDDRIDLARGKGLRTSLLFYYSGHAKGEVSSLGERVVSLRLGTSRLPLSALKTRLAVARADVRIGILDACESGAITREKGGRRAPSFLFEPRSDDGTGEDGSAEGMVLISSSSADESSQESDEIGGSFFTHYLTSGLRGEADESKDLRVTLTEVYDYAYHQTLLATSETRQEQRPSRSYRLTAPTDIVLTNLAQGTSGVTLSADLEGRFMLIDLGRRQVAAEVMKERGEARRVYLPPGTYAVRRRMTDRFERAEFTVPAAGFGTVKNDDLEAVDYRDELAVKGGVSARTTLRAIAVVQSFLSRDTRESLFPPVALLGVGVELSNVFGASLGAEVLVAGRDDRLRLAEIVQPYDFVEVQASVGMEWRWPVSSFDLSFGPRISGLYFARSFPEGSVLGAYAQDHFGISPGVSGGVLWFPGVDRDLSVKVETRSGFLFFSVDENRLLFYGELGLSIGYQL